MRKTGTPDRPPSLIANVAGYVAGMDAAGVRSDQIEIEDARGNRVTVTRAHWNRYPQLAESFRPVADKKAAPVTAPPAPTGDNEMEK